MKNTTIKTKLLISIGILLLLSLLQGGFSINRLNSVNEASTEITQNWLPSVRHISSLNTLTSDLRIAEGASVLSVDAADIAAADKDAARISKEIKSTAEEYKALISSEDERALFKAFEQTWAAYIDGHEKLMALSRQNRNEEAAVLFRKDSRDAFDKASALLVQLVDLNEKGALAASVEGDDTYAVSRDLIIVVLVFALLAGSVAGWLLVSNVSKPINVLTEAMRRLAEGDKKTEVTSADRKDELGAMAQAVLVFKENMIKADELAAKEAEAQKAREARAKRIEQMTGDFDKDVSEVLSIVAEAAGQLQTTATSMTATVEEASRQASAVAAASEQAAANVQTVASAASELDASIGEVTRQLTQSVEISAKAVSDVEHANGEMRGLAEAAQRIGDVINLINDIADQTNLLALNATIEAARAGEAGKGFAVVASEVKNLANQTAKATDEITGQIGSIQSATQNAVAAIQTIGQTIRQVSDTSTSISSAMEEQTAATREIARNVQEASAGTSEVSSNITEVTKAAADTGAAANQVMSSAEDLSQRSNTLSGRVQTFLSDVRAA